MLGAPIVMFWMTGYTMRRTLGDDSLQNVIPGLHRNSL